MKSVFTEFCRDQTGATAIEYGLLAALIGVAVIGGASAFTESTRNMYSYLGNQVAVNMK